MNTRTGIILSLFTLLMISCGEKQDLFQSVQVGQGKEEIKRTLGKPYEIKTIIKTKGPIWGPEEEFWDKIANDTELEVWRYKNTKGNLSLYFEGGKKHLGYKAFAPTGVVYESGY